MTKKWILPLLAFLLCVAAGYRIKHYNLPSSGPALPVPKQVVFTLVLDVTRDRPVRLEQDGVFLMSANAWRRGLTGIKTKLSSTLQSGGKVRCVDTVACEWLGQRGDKAGPPDADVIVASAQYWPEESSPDASDVEPSPGEMRIVIPLTSSRKHGLIGGKISYAGGPINLTSGSTRRDCLLASNDLEDLVRAPLTNKTNEVRQILGPARRRADQLAVDLEYADANAVFLSLLKYAALACLVLTLFGWTIPSRILLTTISGVMIAAATSTLSFAAAPNVTSLILGPILGLIICAIGWKSSSKNETGILLGCLLADLITGGHLGSFSGLGANLIVGARYYGMGNELSAMLFSAALALNFTKPSYRVVFVGILTLLIGHPALGANGGDMIAVIIGILVYAALHGGKKMTLMVFGLVTAMTVVVVWDAFMAPLSMQSHIGRLLTTKGSVVIGVIASKASAHIRLMSSSAWGISALVSLGWWVARYRCRQAPKPDLGECLALPLFLLNDSGPVSITLFTLVTMSYEANLTSLQVQNWFTKVQSNLRNR